MGMNIEAVRKNNVEEQLFIANVKETARIARNYSIEEQIAVAAVLDTEVIENELRSRRRENEADLNAFRKIASRQRKYSM